MKIKISLIIPIYNVEAYLRKCLDSAINQSLKEIEIILVNDGSTDNSLQVCKEYQEKDKRILLIDQENSGLGISRNNAIQLAQGEFVCFLDSDDWLDLETLEACYNKAQKDIADIVVFGFARIDEESGRTVQTRDDLTFDTEHISQKDFFKKVISSNFKHMACAMIAKRMLFIEHALKFPSTLHEDLYVTPKLFYFANKVSFIQKDYYNWLIRAGSITSTITEKHIDGIITAIFYVKTFLLKENIYPQYKDEFVLFYLTYINLLYRRIKSFIKDEKQKKALFEILILKSVSIINTTDIAQIEKEKLKRFQEFLTLYKNYFTVQPNDNTKEQEITINILQSQLNEIKRSRGYKLILKYYKVREKSLPLGSKRRRFIKHIADQLLALRTKKRLPPSKPKVSISSNTPPSTTKQAYDVVFLPHKDYHLWTMGLIARELKNLNISACILDLTNHYRDEGSRRESKNFTDIPFLDFKLLQENKIDFQVLICMNDWDKKVVRPSIQHAREQGKKTIGIVEGVQDFLDLDTKQHRETYQTVEYIFLTGKHDQQFFKNNLKKTKIIGVPRLKKLLEVTPHFPHKALAVINMNFSYNVLADQAKFWLDNVIEGCKKAHIEYIITQHPADKTDLSDYPVTQKTMYQIIEEGSIVISRFGSTIIEALAMGKPCIYHNPHQEQVIKYQEPMGGYSISDSSQSLADAIKHELSLGVDYQARANQFLHHHCNINEPQSSAYLAAEAIDTLIKKGKLS